MSVNFPKTLCEELARTLRSKEWKSATSGVVTSLEDYAAVHRAMRASAKNEEGFTYNKHCDDWKRGSVSVFMEVVRLTCRGRTIRVDDDRGGQPEHASELVFLTPHPAICRLLKQRARDLVCGTLDAVEVLGTLTTDD